ncbi:MAG TPA: DUF3237 domain-containing protein [Runella sp.]|nr:DUF3237 domain-containing protein [Runella sp.]HAO48981.1 DUF3237 domain-containing protein [Runella sp.]
MELEFAFELRVEVANIQFMGDTHRGNRRMIPITGGTFEGPAIKGKIQTGGYDWQVIRTDGVAELDARYVLETEDGALITIVNQGLRRGPAEVMKRLSEGKEVDPSEYYFRSIPVFETADPKYVWLSQSVFVATGIRKPDKVLIQVYKIN